MLIKDCVNADLTQNTESSSTRKECVGGREELMRARERLLKGKGQVPIKGIRTPYYK